MHFLQDITPWRGKMQSMESKMLIQKVVSKNLKGLRNTKNAKTTPC
ncbi:cytotoxicity-associated immunodominant antigen domain protein [Helicobacter pylori Hp P-8b]|nr:cytotoxin-associated protein A [Helicobacter pylori Hp P-8]EJC28051.1 cytotoxicity-associated immunodominant antigen domain protein [Helicobacter pylori Hp P-8b]